MDYVISSSDQGLLASPSQRFELYGAFLPPYHPYVDPDMPTNVDYGWYEQLHFTPVVRFDGYRIGVVGESMTFYGGNSYNRDGSAAGNHQWTFSYQDDRVLNTSYGTTVSQSFPSAGLFRVKLQVTGADGTSSGFRWVRIYNSWTEARIEVIALDGPSGSLDEAGWSMQVTVAGNPLLAMDVQDGAGFVLCARDSWRVGSASFTTRTVGVEADAGHYDPQVVMYGYVVGSSIQQNVDTQTVTFRVVGPQAMLQRMMFKACDFFQATNALEADGYGHWVDQLQVGDALHHLLCVHTNFAEYHDVVLVRQSGGNVRWLSFSEGTVWQNVVDFVRNQFGSPYCDRRGALHCVPHKNMDPVWWGNQEPPILEIGTDNILSITLSENAQQQTALVQINAWTSQKQANVVTYQYQDPGEPQSSGLWEVVNGILSDDTAWLQSVAEKIWHWRNARWRGQVLVGHHHVLDLHQIFALRYENIDRNVRWGGPSGNEPKLFIVTGISHQLDTEQETSRTAITFEERV